MTSSKKGVSEPCWVGKVVTILNEKPPKVKRIPLGHLSDNVSKSEGGNPCSEGAGQRISTRNR